MSLILGFTCVVSVWTLRIQTIRLSCSNQKSVKHCTKTHSSLRWSPPCFFKEVVTEEMSSDNVRLFRLFVCANPSDKKIITQESAEKLARIHVVTEVLENVWRIRRYCDTSVHNCGWQRASCELEGGGLCVRRVPKKLYFHWCDYFGPYLRNLRYSAGTSGQKKKRRMNIYL